MRCNRITGSCVEGSKVTFVTNNVGWKVIASICYSCDTCNTVYMEVYALYCIHISRTLLII